MSNSILLVVGWLGLIDPWLPGLAWNTTMSNTILLVVVEWLGLMVAGASLDQYHDQYHPAGGRMVDPVDPWLPQLVCV